LTLSTVIILPKISCVETSKCASYLKIKKIIVIDKHIDRDDSFDNEIYCMNFQVCLTIILISCEII